MAKRKKFKCRSEAQKHAIKISYAKIAQKRRNQFTNNSNNEQKTNFKLPLKNGGHRWNIYRVSNAVLNGRNDGDVHGGLVLDEKNGNVMLAQVTHSPRKGKRTNIKVSNLNSKDINKETGKLNDSYIERRLIVNTNFKDEEKGITLHALNKQVNDLQFTEEEKQKILRELSHLSTAEERYKLFVELANKKDDN